MNKMSDSESTQRINALNIQFFSDGTVSICKQVVPFVRCALVISYQEEQILSFTVIKIEFIPCQPGKTIFFRIT
jgi:hypothetical protein